MVQSVKDWGAFLLIGLMWGSAFLWNKIGLSEIDTTTILLYRLTFGSILLFVFLFFSERKTMWLAKTDIPRYLFLGPVMAAIPIGLICYSEVYIDSALTSIINGTVPLFSLILVHFMLKDRINLRKTAGLILGFVGVYVLLSNKLDFQNLHGDTIGCLAALGGAFLYALGFTYAKKALSHHSPLKQATWAVASAWMFTAIAWPFIPHGLPFFPKQLSTWVAVTWLGVFCSCMAYILFFRLNKNWGAVRASLVSYTFPVAGVTLGALFLNEPIGINLLVGTLLIILGIAVVNHKKPTAAIIHETGDTA